MCTCIAMRKGNWLFGRNMDIERSFGERAVVVPRGYKMPYKLVKGSEKHFAMLGTAAVAQGVPLFADAVNEKGLCAAALRFEGNAHYFPQPRDGVYNLAPYELIPFLLERCETAQQAVCLLRQTRLTALPFSPELPLAPLHYILADARHTFVAEPRTDGLHLYEDRAGVLTNNPPFPYQIQRLNDFFSLSVRPQGGEFARELSLHPYSLGMGALGLPGDPSSCSRFVRAAFLLQASRKGEGVAHLFHILAAAAVVRGSVLTPAGEEEYTRYSCVIDPKEGAYYYKTYDGLQIARVSMDETAREGTQLREFLPWQE